MGQKQAKAKKAERAEGLTAWLNKMKPKASVTRGQKKVTLYHVERRPRKGCKKPSAYRGVGWDTASRKWKARIEPLGSSTFAYLGRFSSEIDAAVAYSRAVDRYGLPMSGGRGCVAVKAAAALGSKEQAQEALAAVAHEHARGIQQGDAPGTPHASPSAGAKSAARLLRCAEEDAAAQLAAARGGALGCGGEVTHGGGDAAAAALLEQSAAPLVLPLPPLASPPLASMEVCVTPALGKGKKRSSNRTCLLESDGDGEALEPQQGRAFLNDWRPDVFGRLVGEVVGRCGCEAGDSIVTSWKWDEEMTENMVVGPYLLTRQAGRDV